MTEKELSDLRQKVASADELRCKICECDKAIARLNGATCLHFDLKSGEVHSSNIEDRSTFVRISADFTVFVSKSVDPDFTARVAGFIRAEITRQKAEFQASLDNL